MAEGHGGDRRGFLTKAAAVAVGAIVSLFPFAAGLFSFADPLRRKGAGGGERFLRVANASAVPTDGTPRQFPVLANRVDAWNEFPNEPIGAVYLRRLGDGTIEAFNAICPHAGCFVAYADSRKVFQCPCHNSAFALDGGIIQPSPSPRALDKLECKIEAANDQKEVWVKFENFFTGIAEQRVRG